ncbi:phospholipase D-like domain-containing protein [Halorubrum sp. BV1]|uniref:phospholipase D-like domain-containing protein n=1 Tax=Halorubrum sp. BV1 TaxID=1498500 RepID=UPI000679493F|nr:phospholipase D-like domain-containing protein [Halorubrum sp. BV1]
MPGSHSAIDRSLLIETASAFHDLSGDYDYEILATTLRYLQQQKTSITVADLRVELDVHPPDHELENLLDHLRYHQYIGTDADRARTRALPAVGHTAEVLQERQEISPAVDLLATFPDDEALSTDGFDDLLTGVLEVIKDASSHVWIVSPFLSAEAFDRLRPALLSAVDKGSTISLVTRYLTYGGDDGEYNREFTRQLLDSPCGDNVSLYEYVNDETWSTFHAKVVATDNDEAYLGTANVTGKGFLSNLELGVRFERAAARELIALLESLRGSDHFHEVERVAGGFDRTT